MISGESPEDKYERRLKRYIEVDINKLGKVATKSVVDKDSSEEALLVQDSETKNTEKK